MTVLAIDTSSAACSAALSRDGKILGENLINARLTHSQTILPAVEELLEREDLRVSDVDLFAVVAGPGSFTGVRIGVCAVKALCLAADRPCARIDALEAIAEGTSFEGFISPILDARRGQVYTALFERKGGRLNRLTEDRALPLTEWIGELGDRDRVYFTGDGLNTYENDLMAAMGERALIAPMQIRLLRASAACFLAERRPETHMDAALLTPLYLRLPQAERERNERLTRQKL